MPSGKVDIAVIGGGPAGSAAALTLCRLLPGARVRVIESGRHEAAKPGEILPAAAGSLLDRLGVMAEFAAASFVRGRMVASAWASDELAGQHSIFSAQGAGWHLDRARFDRLLLDAAEAAGASVMRGTLVRNAQREGAGWTLSLADGSELAARVLVWATGRSWRLARALQARVRQPDTLVAYTRFFASGTDRGEMIVEARPEGWWYGADLPCGRRVISCMTDPDIGRKLRLREALPWHRLCEETRHLRGVGDALTSMTRAAGTAVLEPASGPGWVAAGDTLFAADPLSSRGITHALRSGTLAAYAVGDMLARREALAHTRFDLFASRGYASYVEALVDHYASGSFWETPFWRRRRPDAKGVLPLTAATGSDAITAPWQHRSAKVGL